MILSLVSSLSFAGAPVSARQRMRMGDRTSQFSRIKQRPLATDLRGPKVSAESFTPRRSNLATADAVDFQFNSSAAVLHLLRCRVTGT